MRNLPRLCFYPGILSYKARKNPSQGTKNNQGKKNYANIMTGFGVGVGGVSRQIRHTMASS
jgi:hypothetical protein